MDFRKAFGTLISRGRLSGLEAAGWARDAYFAGTLTRSGGSILHLKHNGFRRELLIPRAKRAEKISAFLHLNYNDFKLKWLIFRARDKILAFLHLKHKDFRGKLLIPRAKRAKKILAGTLTRSGGCRLGPGRLFRGDAYQVWKLPAGSGTLSFGTAKIVLGGCPNHKRTLSVTSHRLTSISFCRKGEGC